MSPNLSLQWKEALSLSRRQAPEFYQTGDAIEPGPHADAIRFALSDLGLAAVFCIEGVPTIAFLSEPDIALDRIDRVHRVLWNQGLMSLLLVIRDDELVAYSLVQRPFERDQSLRKDPRLIEILTLVADALELRELIDSAESGRFWLKYDDRFDPSQRVDSVLLDNLTGSFDKMKGELGSDAAQALLMQAMFIAYLEDRKIITPEVFRETSNNACSSFEDVLKAKSSAAFESLFAWLKDAFNGDVFNAPCAFDVGGKPPPKVKPHHLRVLADFRHGKVEVVTGQLRLLGYDFEHMPIALISAVYDRFLNEEEADTRNAEGAYYTPMFLADVAVNQLWDELTNEQRSQGTFYDPACGSGIFLVRLFQRLIANHCRVSNKRYATWNELTATTRRLHGGDINPAAVRVAAFSLCIALLEHSNPRDLPALINKGKILPTLYEHSLRAEDFFGTPDDGRYDAIIGNPPWKGRAGQVTSAQQWADSQKLPHPAKDIAWCFIWKSMRVVKKDGYIGLLLPAMGVLHNTSGESHNARRLFLRKAHIKRIINLSDLCFQLFDDAQRPTTLVLFQSNAEEGAPYRFEYWIPKADLNLRLKRMMTLSRADRVRLRSDQAQDDPSIFKRRLWSRSPDEKLLQYIKTLPALNSFIIEFNDLDEEDFDRAKTWAIGQGFQPAKKDADYRTKKSPDVKRYPYLSADAFCALALPEIKTKPWKTSDVRRVGFSKGFAGPHILIPQGLERSVPRVRAAYTEQGLSFQHSLQAIAFPPSKRKTAKLLTAVLNSSLAAWFYFHETSNFGTDRAKVHQKDLLKLPFATPENMPDPKRATAAAEKIVRLIDNEIKQAKQVLRSPGNPFDEIDALVCAYYGLNKHETALVEDTYKFILPAIQPRRSAGLQEIWDGSRPGHRGAYAAMLCDALRPWFDTTVSASLAAKSADIAVLKLTLHKSQAGESYDENSPPDFDEFLRKIGASLPMRLPGNVQLVPDLRFIIGTDMYLVKPMQVRHWLRSTALADAEQIAAEFSAVVARGQTRETRDACG